MILDIPKISVLIICYKQEELIRRAINSLLSQKEYIYEICVSDDCSPDGTWEILQEYDKQYPGLFKLHRNDPNVGIFENIEYTWTMPTGDIIYQLSGDDECGKEWFKTVVEYIRVNKIDYKNELFCIYGDYQAVYPNGDSFISKNNLILTTYNPLGLALRKLICSRSVCYSIKVLKRFVRVSEGRSYAVESAQDMQIQIMSEHNYYIPKVGNIYHTGIGVSSIKNKNGSKYEPSTPMECVNKVLAKKTYMLPRKDRSLMDFYHERALYRNSIVRKLNKCSIWYRIKCKSQLLYLYLSSFSVGLAMKGIRTKRYLFAIVRRLPHNKPIFWYV